MPMKISMFKENQLSIFSQGAIYLLIGLLFLFCLVNIVKGVVPNPYYFGITVVGFIPFAIAKYSVISKGIKFSYSTSKMSPLMANLYRLGYWLMLVGILCTFSV